MTLNISLLLFSAALAGASILFLRCSEQSQQLLDRCLFWTASSLLVIFVSCRPLGIGVDDLGYTSSVWDASCPTFECGHWIQGVRDQAWYTIVGLIKSFYPNPQALLWLSGIGFFAKLWIIDRLCRYRSLALLFYVSCFYLIHDITALRVSLAISIYLVGFYSLVLGRLSSSAYVLAFNGFFHKQAFLAPLTLLGRWLRWTPARLAWSLLLPVVLLAISIYPNENVLKWLVALPMGKEVANVLFGHETSYLRDRLAGTYNHGRALPIVVTPTILLAIWLAPDLLRLRDKSLFNYCGTSLVIAAWLLWGYAVVPEVQLRFWHFFLVPMVFVVGNAQLSHGKLVAILALATIYLLKYLVIHDLLLDKARLSGW